MTELDNLIQEQADDDKSYQVKPDYNGQPRRLGDRLATKVAVIQDDQVIGYDLFLSTEPDTSPELELNPAFEVIRQAELTKRERMVYFMRIMGDAHGPMNFKDIAEMMSRIQTVPINETAARKMFQRAKDKMSRFGTE